MKSLKLVALLLVSYSIYAADASESSESELSSDFGITQESFTNQLRANFTLKYQAALTGGEYKEEDNRSFLEKVGDTVSDVVNDVAIGAGDALGLTSGSSDEKKDLGIVFDVTLLRSEMMRYLLRPVEMKGAQDAPFYLPRYFYPVETFAAIEEGDYVTPSGLRYILDRVYKIGDNWIRINTEAVENTVKADLIKVGVLQDLETTLSIGDSEEKKNTGDNAGGTAVPGSGINSGSSSEDFNWIQ